MQATLKTIEKDQDKEATVSLHIKAAVKNLAWMQQCG